MICCHCCQSAHVSGCCITSGTVSRCHRNDLLRDPEFAAHELRRYFNVQSERNKFLFNRTFRAGRAAVAFTKVCFDPSIFCFVGYGARVAWV
jgi:hypothetical protein